MPPVTSSRPRSAEATLFVADALQVNKPGAFTAGVVQDPATGKVFNVTRCNNYAVAFMCALGVKLPLLTADQLYDYLSGPGGAADGWAEVTADEAKQRALVGFPTLAVWHSAGEDIHGHIAVVIPAPEGAPGIYVSAAGAPLATFISGRIEATFGSARMAAVRYFSHA